MSTPVRSRALPTLAWILAAALALRAGLALLAWLLHHDAAVYAYPDTATYVAPARELASHGTFTVNGVPELLRTPGYPLLMVPGVLLGNVTAVTIALQVALSVATCAGVYLLARELVDDRRAALLAAGIAAVEPLGVQYAALLLSECAFTALLVFALLLLVRYLKRERPGELLGGIVLLCAAAYVRPAGYLLPFACAGLLLLWA
ncbi:MAG TPA: glycosyltransferase family 39 protein, partial [Longimicrobiaceae bacterium]|nr:glycosyltransferase family 39 protein [Longimicrobiaceae bacterium]